MQVKLVVIPIIIILFLSSISIVTVVTQVQENQSPSLLDISGQEQSPHVFPDQSTITIEYGVMEEVPVFLVINNSDNGNVTVEMNYFRYDGNYVYNYEFQIPSYTQFYGFTNQSGQVVTEVIDNGNRSDQYHEVWTTTDRPPVFMRVDNAEIISTNPDERASITLIDKSTGNEDLSIRYRSTTESQTDVTLLWGDQPSLVTNEITMIQDSENTNEYYFTFDLIDLDEREIWFTAFSNRGLEININEFTSLNLHRLTNGISFNETVAYGLSDQTNSTGTTDIHDIYLNFTTINETGVETAKLWYYTNLNSTVVQHTETPELISSVLVNNTLVKKYMIKLGTFTASTVIYPVVKLVDAEYTVIEIDAQDDPNDFLDPILIRQFGSQLQWQSPVFYTNQESLNMTFVLNDQNLGISDLYVIINGNTTDLQADDRDFVIDLSEGNNTVVLVHTNSLEEVTELTHWIIYDTIKPEITDLDIERNSNQNILTGTISDIYGLAEIRIKINNLTVQVEIERGLQSYDLEYVVSLKSGQNTINVTAVDLAGNSFQSDYVHFITQNIQSTDTLFFPPVFILLFMAGCLNKIRTRGGRI